MNDDVVVSKKAIEELQSAYDQERDAREKYEKEYSNQKSSLFGGAYNENLIQWQLELDNILERIDHLLRGHELKFERGNLVWMPPSQKENALFNDYGVQEILRVLTMYLNRNTILSNYDEQMINWKIYDFSVELSDMIFTKYDTMFDIPRIEDHREDLINKLFDGVLSADKNVRTEQEWLLLREFEKIRMKELKEKIKLYPIIITELVDTVHSAYLRALHGGERQSLREARHVTQSLNPNNQISTSGIQEQPQRKKFAMFNPSTWIR